jgi:hypothetical protein
MAPWLLLTGVLSLDPSLVRPLAADAVPRGTLGERPIAPPWAVVHGGALFVCWSGRGDCFERISLSSSGSAVSELAFLGDDELVLGIDGGVVARLHRGARELDPWPVEALAPAPLEVPRTLHCGPQGVAPRWVDGRLRLAPCRDPACDARLPGTKGVPAALSVEVGLEARMSVAAHATPATHEDERATLVGIVASIGVDPRRLSGQVWGRRALQRTLDRRRALCAEPRR